MPQSDECSVFVIEHNVGDSAQTPVPGDCDSRQRQAMGQARIDRNKSFNASFDQHVGVSLKQCHIVAMDDGEKEIFLLPQVRFDSADYKGSIGVSDFLGDNS